jgi:hypothetical protein
MSRIEIIQQELEKTKYAELVAAQDYPGIALLLNEKSLIKNPEPQQDIPKPLQILDLWKQITTQEGLEIYKIPDLKANIENAVDLNKRDSLEALIAIASQLVSTESKSKIQTLLAETIPDPNYKPIIEGESIAQELGLNVVYDYEIQSALN